MSGSSIQSVDERNAGMTPSGSAPPTVEGSVAIDIPPSPVSVVQASLVENHLIDHHAPQSNNASQIPDDESYSTKTPVNVIPAAIANETPQRHVQADQPLLSHVDATEPAPSELSAVHQAAGAQSTSSVAPPKVASTTGSTGAPLPAAQPAQPSSPPPSDPTKPPEINQTSNGETPGTTNAPETPSKLGPTTIDQQTAFWDAYNKAGDLEDKDFVQTSGNDLDALLIFAGLFSAVNTAFIIESYKNLKPDPADETNKLLRSMFSATIDPSSATLDSTPFAVDPRDIRINAFFFTSLCCSLSAAFGAVLAKQWLTQYDRDGGGSFKTPAARGRERHRKYEARDKWHLEDVIVSLPTLLQLSLFFFFVGLIDLLWSLNDIVTGITLSFTLATFIFYITTIAISVYDESAPFQTRLSPLLRSPLLRIWGLIRSTFQWIFGFAQLRLWGLIWRSVFHDICELIRPRLRGVWDQLCRLVTLPPPSNLAKPQRNVDIPCISYLLERVSRPEDLKIVAEAFGSLGDDRNVINITSLFLEFHLKPTSGVKGNWSIPSLCGLGRPSLLKILKILVKEWKGQESKAIQTPSYPFLDMDQFLHSIPLELQKAFLADPADTDSLMCIGDILFTLNHFGHSPLGSSLRLWFEDDMTRNLKHTDTAVQQNTIALLALAAASVSPNEEVLVGTMVHQVSRGNSRLENLIQLAVLEGLLSTLPNGAVTAMGALHLFTWITAWEEDEDIDEPAHIGIHLRSKSDRAELAQSFISRVVETLITTHLKPTLDVWWRLPGLHGPEKQTILRIIHLIVVRWGYLNANLDTSTPSYQLLCPLFSSLRAELWEVVMTAPKEMQDVHMVAEICGNLPMLELRVNDEISISARQKVSTDILAIFKNPQAEPTILQNSLAFLGSNTGSFLSFTDFLSIPPTPGTPQAIPDYVCSTMWVGDTADLEDFWRATFCAQLLPVFFPDELHALRFPEYLHLWLKRYHGQGLFNQGRRLAMSWAYLLSLQRMLSTAEALKLAKELIEEHDHQSHLLDIYFSFNYDEHDTCPLLALHLFLHLWSYDTSDMWEKHAGSVVVGLWTPRFSLTKITRDFGMYAQGSRVGDRSDEQWREEISAQVKRDMGQMVKWLYSCLEVVVRHGLVHMEDWAWDARLKNYSHWCDELDKQLGTEEYRQLARKLRDLISRACMTKVEEVQRRSR